MINNSRRGSSAIIIFIIGTIFIAGTIMAVGNFNLDKDAVTQIVPQFVVTLPAPTNFVATRTTQTNFKLTWQYTDSGQTGFKIERTTNSLCSTGFTETSSPGKSSRSINDGASSNYKYCYRMRAYSGSGSSRVYSPYSNLSGDGVSTPTPIYAPTPTPITSPKITITSPLSGASFYAGQTINIAASWFGTDSALTDVEFNGDTFIGASVKDTTSPYGYSIQVTASTTIGQHCFFAYAHAGGSTLSSAGPRCFNIGKLSSF